jgi:serine protease Do
MNRFLSSLLALAATAFLGNAAWAQSNSSFAKVAEEVNKKLVKVYGAGGISGLPSYGTGVVVSPDGYILTANSPLLITADLRVHTSDGTRYHAKLVAVEPELDVALIKIGTEKDPVEGIPFYDVVEAAKRPVLEAGGNVLAFSNQFNIVTREEPLSVQRGVVAAYARLYGRSGITEAPYTGHVYVVDAITNNPGAAGGVLTTRKGELLGILGHELRNEQTNTWINYAVPISAKLEVNLPDKKASVSILDLVEKKEAYKPINPNKKSDPGGGGWSGIVLVPNVVDRTPPYVDLLIPGSPGHKAGLKPDDLIVYVDGIPVSSISMYREIVDRYRPGSEVKLEVRRGDKLTTVPVKLIEKPKNAFKQ